MKELYLEPFRISTIEFADDRGEFSSIVLKDVLPDFNPVQFNTVTTVYPYVFRGMHWQEPPYTQAKLIRCITGHIIDYVIDIRNGSQNYGRSYAFTLNSKNDWVYVPEGFAHGYLTLPHNLSSTFPTLVEYVVNNDYNKESERGMLITDDIVKSINRELPVGIEVKMKDRDMRWPTINEIKSNFNYVPDEQ